MKNILVLLAAATILFGCSKNIPTPSSPAKAPVKVPTTIYDVKVILRWAQVAPFQSPVLYDSVKASTWMVNTIGSPAYATIDTVLSVPDWFSVYSNDTVTFCLAENGSAWQNTYSAAPPFRKCRETLVVNGIVKMDTVLSDMPPVTSPKTTLIIK
jgi:hypothetical protein